MKFRYQVKTKDGSSISGTMESASQESALEFLQAKGYFVTSLSPDEQPIFKRDINIGRVSFNDVLLFTQQLAILFKSGVPLTESLRTLGAQNANPVFKEKILNIAHDIEGGSSFSEALSKYDKIFSPFFISMVKTGEISGKLAQNLLTLNQHMERENNLRQKVIGATTYPLFILIVFIAVFAVMAFFVIPSFEQVLGQYSDKVPPVTQWIFAASASMRNHGWTIFGVFAAIIVFLVWYVNTKQGKENINRWSLGLPVIGDMVKKIQVASMAESLATLISAGLPISQSLEITADVVTNSVYKDIVWEVRDQVRKGNPMSAVFSGYSDYIPPLMTQMIYVGEKTGNLEDAMGKVVVYYESEVWRTVDRVIGMLEPALIIFLGLVVGFFAIAVFLPIFSAIQSM